MSRVPADWKQPSVRGKGGPVCAQGHRIQFQVKQGGNGMVLEVCACGSTPMERRPAPILAGVQYPPGGRRRQKPTPPDPFRLFPLSEGLYEP